MPAEIRTIVGPPGCGKTTEIARLCLAASKKFGPEGALVVSLTKAAAREAAGRETFLDEKMVGTLHAHCYRALGHPTIVERKHTEEWNDRFPSWELSLDGSIDRGKAASTSDDVLHKIDVFRARRIDPEMWPGHIQEFYDEWRAFKEDLDIVDFTDLIERAITDVPLPPHRPTVMFADEAQDLSRLELTLLKRWGSHVDHVLLVGDGDQALYGWRGSDPEILSGEPWKVLEQSYRVPKAPHAVALEWIRRADTHPPITYHPKDAEGSVDRYAPPMRSCEDYIGMIEEHIEAGRTIMFLAACEYQLNPLISTLRSHGIPYGNPYAKRWNPLKTGQHSTSTADRILSFLKPSVGLQWTAQDLKNWIPILSSRGNLEHGAKTRVKELDDDASELETVRLAKKSIKPDAVGPVLDGDLEWLRSNAVTTMQNRLDYPMAIHEKFGAEGLQEEPKVIIGTVHSVKGGQADTVVVFPDLSRAGYEQYTREGWHNKDAVIRQFYVAMTRTKDRLVLAEPSGGVYVEI